MKKLIVMLFSGIIFFTTTSYVQKKTTDPTGTYTFDGKVTVSDNDTYGYFGEIQVKKYMDQRVIMTFYICKGAPSYNSGSFVDTLDFAHNKVVYTCPESDSSCVVTFKFSKKGIQVDEITDDYNSGCGFGHAVVANGFFKKTSDAVPELRYPATGEQL